MKSARFGIMQAVGAGAHAANVSWIVMPLAIVLGLATGGAASAWFAGSSRIPFTAGLESALPAALGRVHPRWHSPHVALTTCAVLATAFTMFSMVGSSVAEAYQVLLKAAVVIQLIPFIYLFLALVKAAGVGAGARAAGVVGHVTTAFGLCSAFLPTRTLPVALFETKMVIGVVGPIAIGWFLFKRSRGRRGRKGWWGRQGAGGFTGQVSGEATRASCFAAFALCVQIG